MNLVFSVVAAIILVSGIYLRQNLSGKNNSADLPNQDVLSETSEPTRPESIQDNLDDKDSGDEQFPETTRTNTPTPEVKSDPLVSVGSIDNFSYPGANIASMSRSHLSLSTQDNPDDVTNWYKNKIKSYGKSVSSFVTTKTNDNVFNKLVGADSKEELRITIEKKSDSQTVTIQVDLESN